jgi:SAM-dependent methyltransferase
LASTSLTIRADEYAVRAAAWNQAHTVKDADALSGSDPAEMLRHHQVEHLVRPGARVLDIGVGLGYAARMFRERECIVDALDIAEKAEAQVRPWIRNFYLHDRLDLLPVAEYDLAVSHLVAQHMAEPDLLAQVVSVARALHPGGMFSLHLAGSTIDSENNWDRPDIPPGFDGRMCRTPAYMLDIILKLLPPGYWANRLGRVMDWPEFKSYWFWIHIVRAK